VEGYNTYLFCIAERPFFFSYFSFDNHFLFIYDFESNRNFFNFAFLLIDNFFVAFHLITNLPSFIGSNNFYMKFFFHKFVQKSYKFKVMVI